MSSTTMALGSQPASMPAESNLDQMTHLISPARSELSEIDPSWEIRALADADGSIGTSSAHVGAALCASPHTPVCAPPPDLSPDPAANTLSDAATVRRLERERARKKKARAKKSCSVSHLQVVPRADCVWRAGCKGIAAGCSDGNGDSRSGSSGG